MKKIISTISTLMLVSLLLTGCGDGSDGSDGSNGSDGKDAVVVVKNDNVIYDENTTTELNFDDAIVIVPSIEIPQKGGEFSIKFIPSKDKNLILEEYSILLTKKVGDYIVDSTWADVFYDFTHKVYTIEGKINYPYNPDSKGITSYIEMVYYKDGNTKIFQKVEVYQEGISDNVPKVTSDYENFTVTTDTFGNITITENEPNELNIDSVTDDDYINIAEMQLMIPISGVSKIGAVVSFVLNDETYSTVADDNGIWSIDVNGTVLSEHSTINITAVGEYEGEPYIDNAKSNYLVKNSINASITINDITDDNAVDSNESNSSITVSGTALGDLSVGDDIKVDVNGSIFETKIVMGDLWSIDIDGSVLRTTNILNVEASGEDIAKNPILINLDKEYLIP